MRDGHWIRFENFDLERMTHSNIIRVGCAAITAGASRQGAEQVDLGKKLDEIAWPDGARFHEVPMRITRKPGAHENVHHVVNMNLSFFERQIPLRRESSRQIRVTTVVVFRPLQ